LIDKFHENSKKPPKNTKINTNYNVNIIKMAVYSLVQNKAGQSNCPGRLFLGGD